MRASDLGKTYNLDNVLRLDRDGHVARGTVIPARCIPTTGYEIAEMIERLHKRIDHAREAIAELETVLENPSDYEIADDHVVATKPWGAA